MNSSDTNPDEISEYPSSAPSISMAPSSSSAPSLPPTVSSQPTKTAAPTMEKEIQILVESANDDIIVVSGHKSSKKESGSKASKKSSGSYKEPSTKSSKSAKSASLKSTKAPSESTESSSDDVPTQSPAPSSFEPPSPFVAPSPGSIHSGSSKSSKKTGKSTKAPSASTSSKSSKSTKAPSGSKKSGSKSTKAPSGSKKSGSKSSKSKGPDPGLTPDDHYKNCEVGGDNTICQSSQDFIVGDSWFTLDSELSCPNASVKKYGVVDASGMDGMCSCDTTLTTYLLYPFRVINDKGPLSCECFACPIETSIGSRAGFGYRCEESIVGGVCTSLDCEAQCDGGEPTLILPPLDGGLVDTPNIPPGCEVDENDFVVCPEPTPPGSNPTPRPTRRPTPRPSPRPIGLPSPVVPNNSLSRSAQIDVFTSCIIPLGVLLLHWMRPGH